MYIFDSNYIIQVKQNYALCIIEEARLVGNVKV